MLSEPIKCYTACIMSITKNALFAVLTSKCRENESILRDEEALIFNFSNKISSLPKFAFSHKVGNIWLHLKQIGRVFCLLFSRCCNCFVLFFFSSNSLISCSNFILNRLFFLLGWLFCPVNFYRPDFANCGLIPLEIWDEYLQLFSLHYVFVALIHTSHKELSAHPKNLSMTCLTYSILIITFAAVVVYSLSVLICRRIFNLYKSKFWLGWRVRWSCQYEDIVGVSCLNANELVIQREYNKARYSWLDAFLNSKNI